MKTEVITKENNNLGLNKCKISWVWQKYSYLEISFAIRVEDFVRIVKRAGSIKNDPKEKISKIVKLAALLIGSLEY